MVQALSAFPKATLLRGHRLSHESSGASPASSRYTSCPKQKTEPKFCHDIARGRDLPQARDLTHARLQRVTICTEPVVFLEAHKETRTVGSTDFSGSILTETKNTAAYSTVSQLCVGKCFHILSLKISPIHIFLVCYPLGSLKSLLLQSQIAQGQKSQDIVWMDLLQNTGYFIS